MSSAPVCGVAFAQKARHARAVGQGDRAQPQRRGNLAQEAADLGRRQAPDFELDGAAAFGDAHHAGPPRRAAGQGVEAIDRRGLARALEPAAQLGELAVERQAAHVRADDGDRDAIFREHGIVGHGGQLARGLAERQRHLALPARAEGEQRAVVMRRADQGDAERHAVGPETGGQRQCARARRSSRSWCSGRDANCRAPARARDRRRGRSSASSAGR